MFPKITIVTPSYQQARFLERTFQSVLSQGYPNLEYIVLDGGSRDGSVDIIRRYEQHLTYWRSAPDGGQSAAINEGLQLATGDVVGWLNSDDTLAANALMRIGRFYEQNPTVDLLYGHTFIIDEEDRPLVRLVSVPTNVDELVHQTPNLFSQPGTTWRRSVHQRVGYLDSTLHYTMDCDFWIRTAQVCQIRCLPAHLGNLRNHEATKSFSQRAPMQEEMRRLAEKYQTRTPSTLSRKVFRLKRRFRILRDPRNWIYRLGLID
jgi:glycosyltransferase involved in cell wall biosynthesis